MTDDSTLVHVRCIVQGVADVLWLTWERSLRAVWERQFRELARMIVRSLVALAEIMGLRGFDVKGWESR